MVSFELNECKNVKVMKHEYLKVKWGWGLECEQNAGCVDIKATSDIQVEIPTQHWIDWLGLQEEKLEIENKELDYI